MKNTGRYVVVVVLFFLVVGSACSAVKIETVKPDGQPNKAAWMAQGTFGIMTHYLIRPEGDTSADKTVDLNRIVDKFDLDYFIKQFDETGADWLIFTLAQGTGYLSSKSEYIDKLEKGFTPNRDLLKEIGEQLHKRGKRMIIYLPGAYTGSDPTIKRLLGLGGEGYAERHNAFIRDYSLRLGRCHDGWWFDSCGPQDTTIWQKEMDACRAGNPEAVIAFSGAEFCASNGQIAPRCAIEDYHAGEIHLLEDCKIRTDLIWPPGEDIVIDAQCKLRKKGQEAKFYMPVAQFIGNVQWHCLLPIDLSFNPAVPNQYCHYTDAELFRFVNEVKAVGGAITINVPIGGGSGPAGVGQSFADEFGGTGRILQDTHAQLVRLGKYLNKK